MLLKDLLEENRKITGYLTGYSIYNQLGLTTQVSNTVQIGKNQVRPNFKRERYTITFVKQKNIITKDNIPLLQVLDAIRYIKDFEDKKIKRLVRLALIYPPTTRALLGALLEQLQQGKITKPLFKTLNPINRYKLIGAAKVLSTAEKWNIV